MKLSDWLQEQNKGYAEFGREIRVTETSVYRYASGRRIPEKEHMHRIAEATNGAVTANDFYGIENQGEHHAAQQA